MNIWTHLVCVGLVAVGAARPELAFGQQIDLQDTQIQYNRGLNVAPVYEGWIRNSDGTLDMWFGYLNRNWEEVLKIPVGPDNNIQPGGPDQGQPSVFVPRRRIGGAVARRENFVFRVRLPNGFDPEGELIWTVAAHGKTDRAVGLLLPVYEIGPPGEGNMPPTVQVGAEPQDVAVTDSVTLTASVSDDGLPENRRSRANVTWVHYRGLGTVSFEPDRSPIPAESETVANVQVTTTATFSEPGTYMLRAVATDGDLNLAGWPTVPSTAADVVTIEVRPGSGGGGQ